MTLSDAKVAQDCKPGKGAETCRYLAVASGWRCMKLNERVRSYIDDRVAQGTMNARGDNCEGVPE